MASGRLMDRSGNGSAIAIASDHDRRTRHGERQYTADVSRGARVTKPTIGILLHDPAVRARVSAAVGRDFELRQLARVDEMHAVIAAGIADLMIVDSIDGDGHSLAAAVAAIRSGFPTMPILAWCSLAPGASSAIVDLVRSGVSGLLVQGVDDVGHAIRVAVRSAQRASVVRRVYAEVGPRIAPRLQPLLHYAISRGDDELSVEDAAHTIGVDRKTLGNWLRVHRDLSPREFINWVRLAIGAGLLVDSTRTAEAVALELGFASGTAFRNMLQRYTGARCADIRACDGLGLVLAKFVALLAREDVAAVESPVSIEAAQRRLA